MRTRNYIAFLLVAGFVVLSSSCGEWRTSHSGKYDDTNNITINLHHYGRFGIGYGGIGREILESYTFELQPIRQTYTGDEIKLTKGSIPGAPKIPVQGKVSFNSDYTEVTVDLQIVRDGYLEQFAGNGTYKMNED